MTCGRAFNTTCALCRRVRTPLVLILNDYIRNAGHLLDEDKYYTGPTMSGCEDSVAYKAVLAISK